jgi:hypothetical protein
MNEKIKQLWDNSIEEFSKQHQYATIMLPEPLREKFAELIVGECMSQIEEVRQIKAGTAGPVYTQGFEDGMFVAIRTIEEHFGVEE